LVDTPALSSFSTSLARPRSAARRSFVSSRGASLTDAAGAAQADRSERQRCVLATRPV
jgi:hypothetical protein